MAATRFDELNISPQILKAIRKMGFDTMTTVQAQTLEPMMAGRDVMAKAPTGTGKTIAFAVPILEHIDATSRDVQALVLSPTRELALQIGDVFKSLATYLPGVRCTVVYGGQPLEKQVRQLNNHPQILVATPGRLMDHVHRGNLDLTPVTTVVLDEADRMLDMGFVEDVTKILDMMPNRRQLALMSATMSREVMDIAWIYQRDAVEVTVEEVAEDKPQITQYCVEGQRSKGDDILRIIKTQGYIRSIIFCNTKKAVQRLCDTLRGQGCRVDCIHSDIRQSIRERVMRKFRAGEIEILVATDVAARGLDIDDVDAIFNFDIPQENEYYLHRIGRTGRAKKTGVSYTFTSFLDEFRLREIEKYTRQPMIPLKFDDEYNLVPGERREAAAPAPMRYGRKRWR